MLFVSRLQNIIPRFTVKIKHPRYLTVVNIVLGHLESPIWNWSHFKIGLRIAKQHKPVWQKVSDRITSLSILGLERSSTRWHFICQPHPEKMQSQHIQRRPDRPCRYFPTHSSNQDRSWHPVYFKVKCNSGRGISGWLGLGPLKFRASQAWCRRFR